MMQNGSCECTKLELDMHSVPPTMTTMQDSQWMDYHPIASLDSYHAPIEFVLPAHTEYYTNLSQSYLYLKCRILNADGNNLDAGKKVSPVNNSSQHVQQYRHVHEQQNRQTLTRTGLTSKICFLTDRT